MQPYSRFEREFSQKGYSLIAGVDEAGRGPLAGPVVAAAVIFKTSKIPSGIQDSKKLKASERERLFEILMKDEYVLKGIGICDEKLVDELNIRQASFEAMKIALKNLASPPEFVLVDGFEIPDLLWPQKGIPKGDSLSYSIAAASILAKVTRDDLMVQYEERYPGYGFKQHKGYGTKLHLEMLKQKGPCAAHRMSFEPVYQLRLFECHS
jgi:ribonuclease HII